MPYAAVKTNPTFAALTLLTIVNHQPTPTVVLMMKLFATVNVGLKISHAVMLPPIIALLKTMLVSNTAVVTTLKIAVKRESNVFLMVPFVVDGMNKNAMENVFQRMIIAVVTELHGANTQRNVANTAVMNIMDIIGANTPKHVRNTAVPRKHLTVLTVTPALLTVAH